MGENVGAVGAAGGIYAGQLRPPNPSEGRYGNAEQVFRSRHFDMTTTFGITPPTSRSGTPPRRSFRGSGRTPSPRRNSPHNEPRRERSRDESPRGARTRADEALAAEWGGRMLKMERLLTEATHRLNRTEEALHNMVQSGDATKTWEDAFERSIPE